jgi:CheY-like chemotaxis protein
MKNDRPILLIEDDYIDVITMKRALKELGIPNPLVHCTNGEAAVDYLQTRPRLVPAIIFLDINMPRMNGIEFLAAIGDKQWKPIAPIIVLTTSKDESDRAHSFELGVAGYLVKPINYQEFTNMLRTVYAYWSINATPN